LNITLNYTNRCALGIAAIFQICKEEVGDALRKPISNFWYFDTVVKNYASTLVKRGVGGV
jgi:hypothetical protein